MTSDWEINRLAKELIAERQRDLLDDLRRRMEKKRVRRLAMNELTFIAEFLTSNESLDRVAAAVQNATSDVIPVTKDARAIALSVIGAAFGPVSESDLCTQCGGAGTTWIGPWGSRAAAVECDCAVLRLTLNEDEVTQI